MGLFGCLINWESEDHITFISGSEHLYYNYGAKCKKKNGWRGCLSFIKWIIILFEHFEQQWKMVVDFCCGSDDFFFFNRLNDYIYVSQTNMRAGNEICIILRI